MPPRSAHGGFMEPMSRATYYEDVYTRSKRDDDDPIEAGGRFDLCEDSSEDETEDESSKHTKKKTNQLKSYGTIKKPTLSISSDDESQPEHLDVSTSKKITSTQDRARELSAEAFAQEKMEQRRLSPTTRFNRIRKQRMEDRTRIHKASQKAQKTKERALRDAAAAEACLVEIAPQSSLYVLVKRKETPVEFVDCTTLSTGQVEGRAEKRKERPTSSKQWPPKTNWKGEDVDLRAGMAYVLVIRDE